MKSAYPSPRKITKKVKEELPYTMKIHKSLEHIREGKLSDMGLFELSIRGSIECDVFREIKRRIELVKTFLENNEPKKALAVVEYLLAYPQETLGGKNYE